MAEKPACGTCNCSTAGDVSIPALCPLSSPFVEPARAAVQCTRLKWRLKKGHKAYELLQMAARQPSAQVSRQQTAASKPPGELPEVPSSPKALSQMSAGRLSLRESLIAKLLRKYSPVRCTCPALSVTLCLKLSLD